MSFDPGAKLDPSQVEDVRGLADRRARPGGRRRRRHRPDRHRPGVGAPGRQPVDRRHGRRPRRPDDRRRRRAARAREQRPRGRMPDRRRRERPRGLPDRRLRQQHPGLLDRRVRRRPASNTSWPRRASSPTRSAPAAAPPRRQSARSTAPATSTSTSTSGSSTSCDSKFGAQGGPFAQAYVLAHEYGHHVQDLLGTLSARHEPGRGDRAVGPHRAPGRLLRRASGRTTRPSTGLPRAAHGRRHRRCPRRRRRPSATTGSSRRCRAGSTPETWTHGSSAQRQKWFTTGYQSGDAGRCDTFSGNP